MAQFTALHLLQSCLRHISHTFPLETKALPMFDDTVPFCGSGRIGCPSIDDSQRFLREAFETELQEQQSVRGALDETPLPDGVGLDAGQPRQEMAAAPPQ